MIKIDEDFLKKYDNNSQKTFWYCYVSFSRNSTKCIKLIKPVEVRIVKLSDFLYKVHNTASNELILSEYTYQRSAIVFETINECVDYFNSIIRNEIDKLTSNYEKHLKMLKDKLI